MGFPYKPFLLVEKNNHDFSKVLENYMDEVKNESNQETQPKETIAMQLILTADGQLKIVGPFLNDKMACYGILELAKDAIRELHAPKIVKPNGILNFARNGRH